LPKTSLISLRRGPRKHVAPSPVPYAVLESLPDPAGSDAQGVHGEPQATRQVAAIIDLDSLFAPIIFENQVPLGRRQILVHMRDLTSPRSR